VNEVKEFSHSMRRIYTEIKKAWFRPRLRIDGGAPTVRLGTKYGGWNFVDSPELWNATIFSCGLGEDASFDVAFAARYGARVIIVDPTPRAIAHFKAIRARLGQPARTEFAPGGNQPVEAYDLSNLREDSLVLIERAIWTEEKTLRFFAPKNPAHVSHSIINRLHKYSTEPAYIEVESITMSALLQKIGVSEVPLLKLDIEGAEIQVLSDMMKKEIRPLQILVEFDRLAAPSKSSKLSIENADHILRSSGYRLVHRSGASNFLYIR
jgi:FkbM family methyltransferase